MGSWIMDRLEIDQKPTPSCPPTRIHCLVNLLINLVGFLIILLIYCPCQESIFIIWVRELIWINVSLLATGGLRLSGRRRGTKGQPSIDRKIDVMHAITAADGPSLAGPTLDHVVNPDVLGNG
jgi:hypothetical protein